MRKLIAYLLCTFLIVSSGFIILNSRFVALADWLGPLLGSHIYTFFTMIYLLLANPFKYPMVSLTWIITGFLVGLIAGKRIGAVLTAFLIWLTSIPILGLSILGIYSSLDSKGLFTSDPAQIIRRIPVVPSHLDFTSFLQIPVFSELFQRGIETFPSLSQHSNPVSIIIDLLTPLIISFLAKPLLIIISAMVGATYSKPLLDSASQIWARRNKVTSFVLLIIFVSPVMIQTHALNLEDGINIELMEAYTDKQGRVLSGELIIGTEIQTITISPSTKDNLVAAVLLTQKIYEPDSLYSLPLPNITDYLHFMNFIPSTFAVVVFKDGDIDAVKERASHVIDQIQDLYSISFQEIASIPLSLGENDSDNLQYIITVYYSQNTFEETIAGITSGFTDLGGFAESMHEKIQKGSHMDVEMYSTGIIQPEAFEELLMEEIPSEYEELIMPILESQFSFLAGIQFSEFGVTNQGQEYLLDLNELLDFESTPSYVRESDGSAIILARSNKTGDLDSSTTAVVTSLSEDSLELSLLSSYLGEPGTIDIRSKSPSILDLQLRVPEIYESTVSIKRSSREIDGNTEVTIDITNRGLNTVRNLKLMDAYPGKYGDESSEGFVSWSQVASGKTVSHSYTIKYVNPGVYTDLPARLEYEEEGSQFQVVSNTLPPIKKNVNIFRMIIDNIQSFIDII